MAERREALKIYDNIKRAAKPRGVSISAIEEHFGYARGSICKWNTVEPSVAKVKEVAEFLGVPITALLETADNPPEGMEAR